MPVAEFEVHADAPLELATGSEPVTSSHPIAVLGKYKDPRYGDFDITRKDYDGWLRNLKGIQGGRIPIDYDHAAERAAGSTKAAGWITDLSLSGKTVNATIDWTPEGAEAVRARYWLFVSPSFTSHYTDEQDRDLGPALRGVALTNRPFLRTGMPVIKLSQDPEWAVPVKRADSRADMPELTEIAKALTLSEDADEQAIVAKITELSAAKSDDDKSLEDRAKDDGKVLLSKDDHDALTLAAGEKDELDKAVKTLETAVDDLQRRDAERDFDEGFSTALRQGQVDAKSDTRDGWKELYDAAPEATLKRLAAQPKVVNTSPAGKGPGANADPSDPQAQRKALRDRALALQTEKNLDFPAALALAQAETKDGDE